MRIPDRQLDHFAARYRIQYGNKKGAISFQLYLSQQLQKLGQKEAAQQLRQEWYQRLNKKLRQWRLCHRLKNAA
jgi:MoxR-like ATPase